MNGRGIGRGTVGRWGGVLGLWLAGWASGAQPFQFPTANHALVEAGGDAAFLAPTPGHTWESGSFGCVRVDRGGSRLHEGLDIKSLVHDGRGEPTDPVLSSAAGTVAYLNRHPGASNYGNYALVRHYVERMEVYTLYAHLSSVLPQLAAGTKVAAGDRLGTMGRTGQPIGKERAHVHFEINLILNDRFDAWFRKHYPDERNDHGNFHGRNLLGIDPRAVLLEQQARGAEFSLARFVASQPVMARVAVRNPRLRFAARYPQLVRPNPRAEREGVAGYELGLNYNGIPVEMIPRSASELGGGSSHRLRSVNESEWKAHPCGRLVVRRGQAWTLTGKGDELVDLIAF